MTQVEQLLALGATSVGGELYLKFTVLGSSRNGVFLITPAGLELLGQALPVHLLEASFSALETALEPELERAVQVPMQDEPRHASLSEPLAATGEIPAAGKHRTKGRPKKQALLVADYAAGANIEIEI